MGRVIARDLFLGGVKFTWPDFGCGARILRYTPVAAALGIGLQSPIDYGTVEILNFVSAVRRVVTRAPAAACP